MRKSISYICCTLSAISMLTIHSCSKEEQEGLINFDNSVISSANNFVDTRDNTTYPCIKIGNQIWMAENLRYATPGGPLSGCYTWGEATFSTKSITSLDDVPLTDDEWMEIAYRVARDPQYNSWPQYASGSRTGTVMISRNIGNVMGYGQAYLNNMFASRYPLYSEAFTKTVLSDANFLKKLGDKKLEEAEVANNHYSLANGYLYSYDGATAAVPEGWRLPTDDDWKALEMTLGLSMDDANKMEAWRGEGLSKLLSASGDSKFNAPKAGASIYTITESTNQYKYKGDGWYYWSSTKTNPNDSIQSQRIIIRLSDNFTTKVWRGTSPITNGYRNMLYSVRCVKDAK